MLYFIFDLNGITTAESNQGRNSKKDYKPAGKRIAPALIAGRGKHPSMTKVFLLLSVLCLSTGCTTKIAQMTAQQRSERLASERGRLPQLTDPVAQTKSYIKISQLLVTFAADAIRNGQAGQMTDLMEQYSAAVQNARDAIVASLRDAERRPAGYKDLELSLRAQLRLLQDINKLLLSEERAPVENAITTASSVRNEMLLLLFPQSQVQASR